jgi:glycosyltransferase involved in cell wall biosynthesis
MCPFADFHIIGGQDDAIDRLRIRAQCLDNVRIHGFLPHTDAQARMAAFDVMLAPYGRQAGASTHARADMSSYMSPLKLFEYMAAGKAIVCSDHAVLKEVVTNHETAVICSRESPDEWAAALYSLHRDPALRNRLGQNARALCGRSFTWRARVDKVLDRFADAGGNRVAR